VFLSSRIIVDSGILLIKIYSKTWRSFCCPKFLSCAQAGKTAEKHCFREFSFLLPRPSNPGGYIPAQRIVSLSLTSDLDLPEWVKPIIFLCGMF
jgi:hypothetical protein